MRTTLLLLLIVCFSMAVSGQKKPKPKEIGSFSIFADFDQLGISKEDFIARFGPPTAKDMYLDEENSKVETLHYFEIVDYGNSIWSGFDGRFRFFTIFTFKNGKLIDQKFKLFNTFNDEEQILQFLKRLKVRTKHL